MHSAGTSSRTTGPWNMSDAGPRSGSTKLATAIIRAALMLAVISALLLIAALPAQAQVSVIYNFTGGSDGASPFARLTLDGAGNLYGTTDSGGAFGYGTVFELSTNGNETVLYSFTGGADGAYPYFSPVIFDSAGNLYGTTYQGGAYGYGVVFELSPAEGSWTETVLYSFTGGLDGGNPMAGVMMDPAGNLYGTTSRGSGTVFELSPSGGGWTEQVIYAVGSGSGLTMDAAGNIYGFTDSTVFELSPNGNGGWNSAVLHTFTGAPGDGWDASGIPVFDGAGRLYGTTFYGGRDDSGTIFRLTPVTKRKKKGEWRETILHSFREEGPSGPWSGVMIGLQGDIFVTTEYGGKYGYGTIFFLCNACGTYHYLPCTLWAFNDTDGARPLSIMIVEGYGPMWGTTPRGGLYGAGVVWEW